MALDIIIGEKGWHNARPQDVAQEFSLDLHPRDLDREGYQGVMFDGRRVLDYGDLPAYTPPPKPMSRPAPPFVNPTPTPAMPEAAVKQIQEDMDESSTDVQGSDEASTIVCEEMDYEEDKDRVVYFDVETKAGRKRNADEFDADLDDDDKESEGVAKKMRIS